MALRLEGRVRPKVAIFAPLNPPPTCLGAKTQNSRLWKHARLLIYSESPDAIRDYSESL